MNRKSISVSIDPRIELLNSIQYLCGENLRLKDILSDDSSEYKSALINRVNHTCSSDICDIYKKLESLDRENLIKHFVSAEFN